MVLTKDQARNLKARERELERLISVLKRRKQRVSLSPSDLRGDRTFLEQKRLQKKKLSDVQKDLKNKRKQVKNLLSEPVAKEERKSMSELKMMNRAKPKQQMLRDMEPRRRLPKDLFSESKMPRRFNSRRFKR